MSKEVTELQQEPSLRHEAKLFVVIAAPSVLVQLLMFLEWTMTIIYVSQTLGTVAMTGVSLGNLIGNLTGMSFIIGVLSAMDTLAPQAMGSKQYREVGLLAQRGFIVISMIFVASGIIWIFAEDFLVSMHIPAESSALAGRFLRFYLVGFMPFAVFEILRRFLSCQNIVMPFVWMCLVVTFVFHPLYLYAFVELFDFDGAPIAHSLSNVTLMAMALCYIRIFSPHHPETWTSLEPREALSRIVPFMRLGLPGIFSMSEWWFWEVVAFIAANFGTIPLAAHTVVYSVTPLCFMGPFGISIGASIRIGCLLGEGKVHMAKMVARFSVAVGFAVVTLQALLVLNLGNAVRHAFSRDPLVRAIDEKIWPWVCGFLILDGLLGVFTGVIRGVGLQFRMSLSVFASLWVIGIPSLYYVAVTKDLRIQGIWYVMPALYVLMDSLLVISFATKDWSKVSQSIRADAGNDPVSSYSLFHDESTCEIGRDGEIEMT